MMQKTLLLSALCVVLTGCETIGNFADDVGSYMPVLSGERCEHWQCFTDGGRQQSEYNKRALEARWRQEEMEEKGITPEQMQMQDLQQQYQQYSQQEVTAGRTPISYEQYVEYVKQWQQQEQEPPPQAEQPSTYNPPPEMNPYDHYQGGF